MKNLNPLIAVGFLIGTVFWIGVLGWQASYAPTEIEKQKCYDAAHKSGHKSEECKTLWEKTTTDPVALFTLVLAISTVGLWGATIFLYRAGEKQIEVARIGANAADLSARAAIALQLPIIRAKPDKLGWGDVYENGVHLAYCSVGALIFSNLGPTKAFPIEVRCGWTIGGPLPPEPIYREVSTFEPNYIFEPDPKATPRKRLEFNIPLDEGDWSLVCGGNLDVWFYCELAYDDFMQTRHDVGFCWRWQNVGMGMDWRVDETPDYNRKT